MPIDGDDNSLDLSLDLGSGDGLEDIPSADADMQLLLGEDAIKAGLRSSQLREMFEYYLSLREGGQHLPPRSRFNPAEKPRHLPNIFLVEREVQPDGSIDYRYRVYGTGLTVLFGAEMTGKLVSEFPGKNRAARSRKIMDQVVALKRPVRTAGNFVTRNGMPVFGESLVMPFGENGAVTHLLADLDYDRGA
ncbi:MAG: PAS domain-containing protein [Alphaproteobacteria bacterium]|nr:PAS domain-containing protein [Alphaproteobacteria bacterium]